MPVLQNAHGVSRKSFLEEYLLFLRRSRKKVGGGRKEREELQREEEWVLMRERERDRIDR